MIPQHDLTAALTLMRAETAPLRLPVGRREFGWRARALVATVSFAVGGAVGRWLVGTGQVG